MIAFLIIGMALYGATMFWAGAHGAKKAGLLLSLPAFLGLLLSYAFATQSSPDQMLSDDDVGFVMQNFELVALAQLIGGIFAFVLGWKSPNILSYFNK